MPTSEESHKRVHLWETLKFAHTHVKRLQKFGETRWWAKSKAASNIFGTFDDNSKEIYSTLILALLEMAESTDFDSITCSEAQSLLENFCKYETLLISFIMIKIFEYVTPASNYLQTEDIDFIQAYHLVTNGKSMVNEMYDKFDLIVKKTNAFLNYINQIETFRSKDIVIEHELPQQMLRKRKRIVDETTEDSVITDTMKKFEVFKSVINQAIQSISQSLDLLSDSKFTDIAEKIRIDNVELKK
ncbi:unnamed protein product [Psylliodes chrysocephalus]|uniref:Uncharacterized protein n=1 Tax=Psylliodes chrysocephalus TaxID=3402493 RepID=A0A9P0D5C3_9CUCU|nr:unnamed protein product [Psylliodes chrysocephala]